MTTVAVRSSSRVLLLQSSSGPPTVSRQRAGGGWAVPRMCLTPTRPPMRIRLHSGEHLTLGVLCRCQRRCGVANAGGQVGDIGDVEEDSGRSFLVDILISTINKLSALCQASAKPVTLH